MSNKKFWALLLVVPFLLATQVQAQGLPTGVVTGRVAETEGLPLPGVSITAKSPALQGSRTAVTNVNGDYTIPNLPPGEYVITFVMSGFQSVTRNVKVSASQTIPLSTKLSISSVAAEATVVAQSETVSQTSQASTTYSTELTNKLPVARTITGSVVLSAGVNQNGPNGNATISGAQSFDNNYTINGVNIQDNIRGTPGALFIEDAIQETTTMTSGVSAEFGRFTGGVINAVTKQGGNSFSGSIRATLNNDNWQSQSPIEVTRTDKVIPTYEATLGGPIWKDRIWFFGAGRYTKNEYSGSTAAPIITSFPRADTDTRYEGKLTITPFMNHTVTGSYTNQLVEQTGYYYTPWPILATDGVTYPRSLPSDLLSLNYNGVITPNFFIEAQYSAKNFKFENSGSRFNELIKGTAVISQSPFGQVYGSLFCAVCPGAGETRNNEDYLLKGTYFLSTKSLGSHNIVFGYDHFSTTRMSNNWQSGSSWLLFNTGIQSNGTNLFPVIDENSYLLYAPIPQASQGSDMLTHSFFVNDTMRLNNQLSFNIGLRYDKNKATDAAGATTSDDSAFSPRLGVNWDLRGDGKVRISASYATYVGQIQEGIAGSGATAAGSPASYYYYWGGSPINTNTTGPWLTTEQVLAQMFAFEGVTGLNMFPNRPADSASVPGVNLLIQNSLSSPKSNEFVLGFGGTVGNVVYRMDAVRRDYSDFYATRRNTTTGQVTDSLGNVFDMGYLINSNIPERNYTGLHTSVAWRSGGLNLAANWTWSHMIGNFVGETAASGPVSAQFENYPEYFDAAWSLPKGSMSQDQRHRIRLVGTYDFSLGPVTITPGLVQSWDTGTPYGAVGNIASSPYVTNPGYEAPPTRVAYYFANRDAYRTDDIYRTDLSLNISGKLGPVEIFVIPQVLNLFNNDAIVTPNTSISVGTTPTASPSTGLSAFNPFTTAAIECPTGAPATECAAMGANWQKARTFGTATSAAAYQIPRRWSISMGIRF